MISLLVAQLSSLLTTIVGLIAVLYIFRAVNHLENDSFRETILSLGVFMFITIVGVASMTLYHFLDGYSRFESLRENAELLWHAFLFLAILYSCYASYLALKLGKSLKKIETIFKSGKKEKNKGKKKY